MVRRNQHFQSTPKLQSVAQWVLCGLVTSCGLLDNVKEVPRPLDSVLLSNQPRFDAGDAAQGADASRPETLDETQETATARDAASSSSNPDAGRHDDTKPVSGTTKPDTTKHSGEPA